MTAHIAVATALAATVLYDLYRAGTGGFTALPAQHFYTVVRYDGDITARPGPDYAGAPALLGLPEGVLWKEVWQTVLGVLDLMVVDINLNQGCINFSTISYSSPFPFF